MDKQVPREEQKRQEPGREAKPDPLAELYETLSRFFRENLERAGTLSDEAFERALHEAREQAGRLRQSYADDVAKVADSVRRDWNDAIRFTQEQTRGKLELERLQAGALGVLARLARSAGEQLEAFASRINQRLSDKTGEIAGAGTLACERCEQTLHFEKATRIPPCPRCHGSVFRRRF